MTTPTACILAAGRGSRLGTLTDELPKSLMTVGGRSIVDRQLEALQRCGIPRERTLIVTGHAREAVADAFGDTVATFHNPLWDVHNNLYTVHLLSEPAPDDLLLINGDTLFAPDILAALLAAEGDAVMAVDDSCKLAEENMKVVFNDGRLARIGKDLDPAASDGEYIGLLRFRGDALATFYAELAEMVAAGRTDGWYEGAVGGIAARVPVTMASTRQLPWIEVDTPEDLAAAQDVATRIDALPQATGS